MAGAATLYAIYKLSGEALALTVDPAPGVSVPVPPARPAATPNVVSGRPVLRNDVLSIGDALRLVEYLDRTNHGGWFQRVFGIKDVAAIWMIESGLKSSSIGDLFLAEKSWGLGQVQGRVARIDYGLADARAMLDPFIGGGMSMRHLKWTYDYMARRLGRAPTKTEIAAAYNAGAPRISGDIQSGKAPFNTGYISKFIAARRRLG